MQIAPLHYPHLSHTEIFESVEEFYRKFYFRGSKIASIVNEMVRSPQMMKRRLREGWSSSSSSRTVTPPERCAPDRTLLRVMADVMAPFS